MCSPPLSLCWHLADLVTCHPPSAKCPIHPSPQTSPNSAFTILFTTQAPIYFKMFGELCWPGETLSLGEQLLSPRGCWWELGQCSDFSLNKQSNSWRYKAIPDHVKERPKLFIHIPAAERAVFGHQGLNLHPTSISEAMNSILRLPLSAQPHPQPPQEPPFSALWDASSGFSSPGRRNQPTS